MKIVPILILKKVAPVNSDGSVKSSAGTYTAWIEVIEPFLVEVIRETVCVLHSQA
jgi:hypothetical protein